MKPRPFLKFALWCAALCMSHAAGAAPLSREDVPAPLKPWVPWALHGAQESPCPLLAGSGARACVWPGRLELDLGATGGKFSQTVRVYGEAGQPAWVPLPGTENRWPQDVQVDGKGMAVVAVDGLPGLYLSAGEHRLSGRFAWGAQPENLALPKSTGMVALSINGKALDDPRWDENGLLTLANTEREARAAERVEIRINRLLSDEIPLTIATRISLAIAGKNREISLPGLLPPGAVPLNLASSLPARLDADGKLVVQVRPGQWELTLLARLPGPVKELKAPTIAGVAEEVWAFSARPALRQVTLAGPPQIDPQQTTLPQDWRNFPAYRIKAGDVLTFTETRRGDATPNPDQLNLSRQIWLDFDGGGYTVRDQIGGTLSQSWRLAMQPPYALGRATLSGRDQLITLGEGNSAGIEVRTGRAAIGAESRLEGGTRELPAVGWSFDAQRLSAVLNLPPGWRLLAVGGVDQAQGAWVGRWSLLDFFLVLIAAVAAFRLWGVAWGAAMLALLVLTWHEPGAPRWVWINLVAAVALARALAATRLGPWLLRYRYLAWAGVVIFALPFMVNQVRESLYPALEMERSIGGGRMRAFEDRNGVGVRGTEVDVAAQPERDGSTDSRDEAKPVDAPAAPPPAPAPATAPMQEAMPVEKQSAEENAAGGTGSISSSTRTRARQQYKEGSGPPVLASTSAPTVRLDEIDPKAIVQTGPGLPRWQWQSYALSWNGPVEKTQTLKLWLLPPWAKALAVLLQVLLIAVVLGRALDAAGKLPGALRNWRKGAGSAAAVAMLALLWPSDDARAATPAPPQAAASAVAQAGGAYPDAQLLNELRERLTPAVPRCRPNCASIARLRVENAGNQLRLLLEIHAADHTAVPLPGGPRQWLPTTALLDARPAPLLRGDNNQIWVALTPGVHQLTLLGPLPPRDALQLGLPLKPRRVESSLTGWQLDGVDADGSAESSLQLSRAAVAGSQSGAGAAGAAEGNIPAFSRIERTLLLGLEWRVSTRVTRLNAPGLPLVVEVPLLPGENVISADIKAENGKARVSLPPQAGEATFESTLPISAEIKLTAAPRADWVEVWRLDAGTLWHVELSGIPVIARQSEGRYLPQWQPWPGESVSIKATRPAAQAGPWLTMDEATLQITPGSRVAEMQLSLALRASRGGEHIIGFPEGVSLQGARINGRIEPLKLDAGKLKLPINPGAQQVVLTLRAPEGMDLHYVSPAIALNLPGLNEHVRVNLPRDRWLLWFDGPRLGPAILLWGVVLVLVLIGFGLGRTRATPLKSWQWILLLLGLTQAGAVSGLIIVGWLFALAGRERASERVKSGWFNVMQVLLALLTLLALALLLEAVRSTLLGTPQMQITGNGSSQQLLHWYQDRGNFPVVHLYSLPLLVWRGLMLAWALWLAWSLIAWLRWGWSAYGSGGLWRKGVPRRKQAAGAMPAGAPADPPDTPDGTAAPVTGSSGSAGSAQSTASQAEEAPPKNAPPAP